MVMILRHRRYWLSSHVWKQVLAGFLTVALVLGFWWVVSPQSCAEIIRYGGYWSIVLCFGLGVALLVRRLGATPIRTWLGRARKHLVGIVLVAIAGTQLQLHEPRQHKILFDEFAFVGVAYSMHHFRETVFPTRGHYADGRLQVLSFQPDKRPFFFPFLISAVHDLTGYRSENVFYLNILLGYLLFLSLYIYGCSLGGVRAGYLAIALVLGVPLLGQIATSGGYDLLNLCMLVLSLLAISSYLRSAGTRGLSLMAVCIILLAQVRYESVLFVLLIPAVVLLKWYRTRVVRLTWLVAVLPAFLLMPLLVHKFFNAYPVYRESGEGVAFFSSTYFIPNLQHAIYYLFNWDLLATNSLFLSLAGVFAVALLLINRGRLAVTLRALPNNHDLVLALFSTVITGNTIVMLCNFWGHWDDPMVSRFSLPLQLAFVFAIVHAVVKYLLRSHRFWPLLFTLLVVRAIVFTVPSSSGAYATRDIAISQEVVWLKAELAKRDPARTLTFMAGDIGIITWGYPATDPMFLDSAKWKVKVLMDEKIYDELLVFQRLYINPQTLALEVHGRHRVPAGYKLQTVAEFYPRFDIVTRLSRIVAVEGEGLEIPPEVKKLGPPYADGVTAFKRRLMVLP